MQEERGSEKGGGRWLVRVPRGGEALRVWVNGVEQHEGDDYVRRGDTLVFAKPLAKEGRIGFWRWTLMVLGIAGTYRKNDSVDVQYELNGRTNLATQLDIEAE
jgi:hypothetical protein